MIVVSRPTDTGFTFTVYNNSQIVARPTAEWFDGPNFFYKINGEQITGYVHGDSGTVHVQNRSGSWKSSWYRAR